MIDARGCHCPSAGTGAWNLSVRRSVGPGDEALDGYGP